ncbi:MAG: transketolase [Ruminococcaceae bacterium]|nr:transketolase [Oscillospiraceae bacterium]
MDMSELKEKCRKIRIDIINMVAAAKCGHPGGSLSSVELMVALFNTQMKVDPKNPNDPNRDRFVLSKGHCAPVYYAVLCDKGFFPREELSGLRQMGRMLQGHPVVNKIPGVDASSGSLGQGMSIATGMALGAKKAGSGVKVYTLCGDGELQEGLIWEAAMAAAHYKLDNLTVIVDNNGMQIDGTNDQVMSLGCLRAKFEAFGFNVVEVADGNDLEQVLAAFEKKTAEGKPKCILAHTLKGKGVSYMEGEVSWHGKAPNEELRAVAVAELEAMKI